MQAIQRPAGAFLAIVGLAVGIHFVIDPFIYDWAEGDDTPVVWVVLDWLMVIGLIYAVVWSVIEKRSAGEMTDSAACTCNCLGSNANLYLGIALLMLVVWNIGNAFWPAGEGGADGQVWVVIDIVLPLFFGTLGWRLWNTPADA